MSESRVSLDETELRDLEEAVERALASGEQETLPVLGFGEISLVLASPPEDPRFACKRLPPFPSRPRFEAYRETLDAYLGELAAVGVSVVDTEMRGVELTDGSVAGYVVQPVLPPETLATRVLRRSDPNRGHPMIDRLVTLIAETVTPQLGLDAQLSNWTWDEEALTYIDVSTPLIWSEDGRCLLDMDLIAEAYPAILRRPLRRFVAPRILDTFRDLRGVYLDLCGNLVREQLDAWLPPFFEAINPRLREPLDGDEVQRYFRSDARIWGALFWVRRLDRIWRERVRGRPYPFLLPAKAERDRLRSRRRRRE